MLDSSNCSAINKQWIDYDFDSKAGKREVEEILKKNHPHFLCQLWPGIFCVFSTTVSPVPPSISDTSILNDYVFSNKSGGKFNTCEFGSNIVKWDKHVFVNCTYVGLNHGFLYSLENCFASFCVSQNLFLY